MKTIDILCVGELLIDCIGMQMDATISETKGYERYLGGSPTNVAVNMSRLGLQVRLASTVGDDGFGEYIRTKLRKNKINADLVRTDDVQPTSLILVSKTTTTPEFIPYRHADMMITENQLPFEVLQLTKIFHTTAFALSKNPARNTILGKAKEAANLGCRLSIDVNYAFKVWPDRKRAMETITEYCKFDPLVKVSEDDMERLFGEQLSHDEIFVFFHEHLKVSTVCLTLGSKGVKLSQKPMPHMPSSKFRSVNGKTDRQPCYFELPAQYIEKVLDATGAGDAFWSGFLFAYLNDLELERCLKVALALSAIKLQHVGRLPIEGDLLSQLLKIT